MNEETREIFVKMDEPYHQDPDPQDSRIFIDQDGKYYRVFPFSPSDQIDAHPGEGWEVKKAIKKTLKGRVNAVLIGI